MQYLTVSKFSANSKKLVDPSAQLFYIRPHYRSAAQHLQQDP